MDTEQDQQLSRVRDRIAPIVLAFCHECMTGEFDGRFFLADLVTYVMHRAQVSPESPSRILRHLAAIGRISYTVLSRSESLYQLHAVNGASEAA